MENVPNKVTCPCLNKISKNCIFSPCFTLFGPFLVWRRQNGPKLFSSEFWGQTISNEGSYAYVWKKLQKMVLSVPKRVIGPKKRQKMTSFKKWKKRPQEIFPTSGKHKRIILKTIQWLKSPPQKFCLRTDGRTTTMIALPLSEISPRCN